MQDRARSPACAWLAGPPFPGGAPANVAAALAKLGVRVAFVSALGRDELGDQMLDLLSSALPLCKGLAGPLCTALGRPDTGSRVQARAWDVGAVQRVERPTRDVLVVSDAGGDREFVGFGGPNDSFADTVINAGSLPEDVLAHASALVMGSLGLAFPATAEAMRAALQVRQARHLQRASPLRQWRVRLQRCTRPGAERVHRRQVLIDVNWRPVFWDGVDSPRDVIKPYVLGADIVKLSEEEAEWLLDIPGSDALEHPCKVRACSRPCLLPLGCSCRRSGWGVAPGPQLQRAACGRCWSSCRTRRACW